jgi:uncharacterized membrane protein
MERRVLALLLDWTELLVRWTHVIAGITWIGSSFYFIALDASLKGNARLDTRVKGEAWQVHGGGFYNIQKFSVAPEFMPAELTWFKWEAYATWIFGFLLLVLMYYANASLYLIDPAVMALQPGTAVAIAAGSLVAGWLGYNALCRSRIGDDTRNLALVGFGLLIAIAFAYSRLFSGRGAFIQIGALVGTIMAANVLMIIIPNQRKVVASLLAGEAPDPALGAIAKQRSLHNNYLTLPVLFTMLSNHYAFTYQSSWNWLVLAGVFISSFLVRHWFNVLHTGEKPDWRLWPAAAVPLAAVVVLSAATSGALSTLPAGPSVKFAEVQGIIAQRCHTCHAARPSFTGFVQPPKNVMFDTPAQIVTQAPLIYAQAVTSRAMPLGNITQISDTERQTLATWFQAGATAQ